VVYRTYLFIQEHQLFDKNDKILVGVSGGPDSIALAHILKQLGFKIGIAHYNFKLRGEESDRDQKLVEEFAHQLEVPLYVTSSLTREYAEMNKLSVEMAARKLRYEWFDELMQKYGYDYLLTAHHANDNVETFFINLLRGSGLKGLGGIPETERIKRPLLHFSRKEIEAYALRQGLQWREDRSNRSLKYLRNSIRHRLMPLLEEIRPGAAGNILSAMEKLKKSAVAEEELFARFIKEYTSPTEDRIIIFPGKISSRELREWFLIKYLSAYGFTDTKAIRNIASAQTGKRLFSPGYELVKHDGDLILFRSTNEGIPPRKIWNVIPATTDYPVKLRFELLAAEEITREEMRKLSPGTVFVDADLLKPPLEIRPWQAGDRMQPIGMRGTKKISDILTGMKIPLPRKKKVFLLLGNGIPVWLIGLKPDERFKVGPSTRRIWKITFEGFSNEPKKDVIL
jgi:tRNA(Ile)-lysidine synthase